MAAASLPRTASRSRSSPRWTTTSACCASYSARTEDRRTSCISAQPLSGGARPLASTAAEDAGAQLAQLGLGQSGELDQLRPLDRAALVDAQRLAGFNVHARPPVQIAREG